MKIKFFIPLVVLLGMSLFFAVTLSNINTVKEVISPLVGKPAPTFTLPRLFKKEKISTAEMAGKVWMLNYWASWCVSCRAEHKVLTKLIETTQIPVIGLNYKDYGKEDYGQDAVQWLANLGNPYIAVAVDTEGTAGFDWGVVAVPETFVIDKKGIIRYKFTGPVYDEAVKEKLLPLIEKLRKEEG